MCDFNSSDHDLLQRVSVEVRELTKKVDKVLDRLDSHAEEVAEWETRLVKIESTVESQRKIFWGVIPGIILALALAFLETKDLLGL